VKPTLLFLLTAALCALISCSTPDHLTLRLTSPLPNGIIQRNAPLVFDFSRGVVPESELNKWTTDPFVEFTPAIPGMFVWQDSTRLVFTPDGMFPGDITVEAKLNVPLLLKTSGAATFKGDDEFTFSTQPFTLAKVECFYDRIDNRRTVGVRMNLEFTYAVLPADVQRYLTVTINGKPHTAFTVQSQNPATVIPVDIGSMTQLEAPKQITVMLAEGLTSTESNTPIKIASPFVYRLPGLEELKIHGHNFSYDGTSSAIDVETSQEIDPAAVKDFVSITPARKFTVEPSGRNGFRLRGNFEPGVQFQLVVKKELPSVLGAKTRNEYQASIVIGNVRPSYRFSSNGMYMLLGGAKSVEFSTVNVANLRVRVSQVFRNNIVYFLHNGRSYDYYYGGDDEEGDGGYHRKYRFYLGNYGRFLEERIVPVRNVQNREVTTGFDLQPFLKEDHKGFYLLEISDMDGD